MPSVQAKPKLAWPQQIHMFFLLRPIKKMRFFLGKNLPVKTNLSVPQFGTASLKRSAQCVTILELTVPASGMDTRPSFGIGPSTMMLNPFHNSENYSFHPKALKQHSVSCTYLGIGGSKSTQECNRSFFGTLNSPFEQCNLIWCNCGCPTKLWRIPTLAGDAFVGWLKLGKPPFFVSSLNS